MKKTVVFLIISFISTVSIGNPERINSISELLNKLKDGYTPRIIINYSLCISDNQDSEVTKEIIGGMTLDNFEYFSPGSINNPNGYIATSESHLIQHNKYGNVLNYIKIRFFDNEKVEIIARYLNPETFEVIMDQTYKSIINNSKNNGGVSLFLTQ